MPTIIEELAGRGYILGSADRATRELPIEELIIEILKTAKEGREIEGLPIAIKNSDVDYDKLTKLALQNNAVNGLGYILEITRDLFKEFNISDSLGQLESTIERLELYKDKKEHYLVHRDNPHYPEIAKNRQTPLQKRWNVLGLFSYERFRHAFDVYK